MKIQNATPNFSQKSQTAGKLFGSSQKGNTPESRPLIVLNDTVINYPKGVTINANLMRGFKFVDLAALYGKVRREEDNVDLYLEMVLNNAKINGDNMNLDIRFFQLRDLS